MFPNTKIRRQCFAPLCLRGLFLCSSRASGGAARRGWARGSSSRAGGMAGAGQSAVRLRFALTLRNVHLLNFKKRMIDNDKSRADGPSQLLTAQQHRVKLAHPMLFFLLRLYAA